MIACTALLLLTATLAACGQRGPLYLPDERPVVTPPQPSGQPSQLPPEQEGAPADSVFADDFASPGEPDVDDGERR